MTSGPCTVTEGGACFRTPNYPDAYGSSQDCEIAVSGAGFVRATAFDTESGYDYVTIGGTQYGGDGGALASSGVLVGDGTAVAWHADSSNQRSGAEVCGASCEDEFCGPHGSCGSDGTTCTCHPIDGWSGTLWSGDTCDQCPEGWGGNSCEVRYASVSRALY